MEPREALMCGECGVLVPSALHVAAHERRHRKAGRRHCPPCARTVWTPRGWRLHRLLRLCPRFRLPPARPLPPGQALKLPSPLGSPVRLGAVSPVASPSQGSLLEEGEIASDGSTPDPPRKSPRPKLQCPNCDFAYVKPSSLAKHLRNGTACAKRLQKLSPRARVSPVQKPETSPMLSSPGSAKSRILTKSPCPRTPSPSPQAPSPLGSDEAGRKETDVQVQRIPKRAHRRTISNARSQAVKSPANFSLLELVKQGSESPHSEASDENKPIDVAESTIDVAESRSPPKSSKPMLAESSNSARNSKNQLQSQDRPPGAPIGPPPKLQRAQAAQLSMHCSDCSFITRSSSPSLASGELLLHLRTSSGCSVRQRRELLQALVAKGRLGRTSDDTRFACASCDFTAKHSFAAFVHFRPRGGRYACANARRCPDCGREAGTSDALREHLERRCRGPRDASLPLVHLPSFDCDACGAVFASHQRIARHCVFGAACQLQVMSQSLDRELATGRLVRQGDKYTCSRCRFSPTSQGSERSLLRHAAFCEKRPATPPSEDEAMVCDKCAFVTGLPVKMARHMASTVVCRLGVQAARAKGSGKRVDQVQEDEPHNKSNTTKSSVQQQKDLSAKISSVDTSEISTKHSCSCGFATSRFVKLKKHKATSCPSVVAKKAESKASSGDKNTFTCRFCLSRFPKLSAMREHIRSVHRRKTPTPSAQSSSPPQLSCPECLAFFSSSATMRSHQAGDREACRRAQLSAHLKELFYGDAQCSFCSFVGDAKAPEASLLRHFYSEQGCRLEAVVVERSRKLPSNCMCCFVSLRSREGLRSHLTKSRDCQRAHLDSKKLPKAAKFRCGGCPAVLDVAEKLRLHRDSALGCKIAKRFL